MKHVQGVGDDLMKLVQGYTLLQGLGHVSGEAARAYMGTHGLGEVFREADRVLLATTHVPNAAKGGKAVLGAGPSGWPAQSAPFRTSSPAGSPKPASRAITTAVARSCTSSLAKMRET